MMAVPSSGGEIEGIEGGFWELGLCLEMCPLIIYDRHCSIDFDASN